MAAKNLEVILCPCSYFAVPPLINISPFIRHWEPAKFDVVQLAEVNSRNLENRKRRRKRRDVDGVPTAGEALLDHPQEPIRMNFSAHDRYVLACIRHRAVKG